MSGKTDLQREILLSWYDRPNSTNKEIAETCDCSASYVSEVKNRFNNYDEFVGMIDCHDKELEHMFGEDFFQGVGGSIGSPDKKQQNFAQLWKDLPNDAIGALMKALIIVVFLYVGYQTVLFLI